MAKFQMMVFELDGNQYGIDIHYVNGIFKAIHCNMVPLPKAPPIVKGITHIRGKVIPVIDMRKKLGYEEVPINPDTKFIQMVIDKQDIGFLVDEVTEIMKPDDKDITDASHLSFANSDAISHIVKTGDTFILVLKMDTLLSGEILHVDLSKVPSPSAT